MKVLWKFIVLDFPEFGQPRSRDGINGIARNYEGPKSPD